MDIVVWIFTLGYFFQLIATLILILKIQKQKSTFGLCLDTQYLFLLGSISRCFWLHQTRLINIPFALIELVGNTLLLLIAVYLCEKYRYTATHSITRYLRYYSLALVCIVLSFCFHPGRKNSYYLSMQMLVAFTMFSESLGLLPQLYIMRKAKEVEVMTSRYLCFLGLARLCRLIFWIKMYLDGDLFVSLIVADLVHSLIFGYFAFHFFKFIRLGQRILLP